MIGLTWLRRLKLIGRVPASRGVVEGAPVNAVTRLQEHDP